MSMKIVVDVKDEHETDSPCVWNNIAFAVTTAADGDMDVEFMNCNLEDVEEVLLIIAESVQTGLVLLRRGILIYHADQTQPLQMDFGKK